MKYIQSIVLLLLIAMICMFSACSKNSTVGIKGSENADSDIHNHVFVGTDCTESGKCICGETNEPLGHDFTKATCTAGGKCSRCEATNEALGHDFSEATCTVGGKCSRCDVTNEALGHDFSEATCTVGGKCSRCEATNEALGHNFSEATCTAGGKCSRCGVLNGSALGHSYSGGRCKRCNDTNGPLKPNEAALFKNKLTDEENAQALAVAREIVKQINAVSDATNIERIQMAAYLVSQEYRKGIHLESGNYYSTAYGVFIKRESSCAGCCRALGLVLSCMGYEWNHVNENLWTHQWVTLTVDGQSIWADGQIGYAGDGDYPFA